MAAMSDEEWAVLLFGDDRQDPEEAAAAIDEERVPDVPDYHHAAWHWKQANLDEAQAAMYRQAIDDEIARLGDRRDEIVGPIERRVEWHRSAVEAWHRAELADKESTIGKTVKFPSGGSSELRAQRPAQVGDLDEEALRVYLEEARTADGQPVVDDNGEPWHRKVFKSVPDSFMVSELNRLAKPPTDDLEEGAIVQLIGPDGKKVPGLKFRTRGDRWQAGKG